MAAKLLLDIIGNATSAVDAIKKTGSAAKTAGGEAKTTSQTLMGLAKAVATGYAVKKVVDFGKATIDVAGQAVVANKTITAVFKNVGDATGEAAKHAIDLAESFGRQAGISPTVIKGGEAILATFHSVSDATGMQSGVFDRATKAAADLAAAGFGSMDTNAKQLGKALQDPTTGMSALRRAGVNFTSAQQDQIKAMQKSGDLLGAQKQILAEVEGQVKGTATATAGSGAKMKVAYEEMQASIGTALLPAVSKVKGELGGLFNFVSANASWLVPLAAGIGTVVLALLAFVKAFQLFGAVKEAIAGVRVAWMLLNTSFIASPIGIIITAIVALAVILVVLYLKVSWFRDAVNAAWSGIVTGFQAAWNFLVGLFNGAVAFLSTWGTTVLAVILGPFGIVFVLVLAFIRGGWAGVVAQLSQWAGLIGRILAPIVGVITAPFIAAWNAIYNAFIGPVIGAMRGIPGAISGAISGVFGALIGPFQAAWNWINSNVIGPLKGAWNAVAHALNAVHISATIPSNPITDFLHIAGKGFDWSPPWHVPTLARGGLITQTGLVYAHAGEAISPIPSSLAGRSAPAVQIEHAHFSEKIDVETFGRRLAWTVKAAGI